MVMAQIASIEFNWKPDIVEGDDPEVFMPKYVIMAASKPTFGYLKTRFADLPSSGIWEDRIESNDELLEQLGGDWRGLAIEQ